MAKASAAAAVYQIKITLAGSKPPIWRRFTVPGEIDLEVFHYVIQMVMGWEDSHLHAFEIGGERYTAKSMEGVVLDVEGLDERKFRLRDVVATAGAKTKFKYEYDFGDSWEHVLLVEKIIPASEKAEAFVCLKGEGKCPPEDCGGIWGYYRLLDVLNNPDDPEHEDMMDWIGGKIDAEEFDLEAVNKSLAFFRKQGR